MSILIVFLFFLSAYYPSAAAETFCNNVLYFYENSFKSSVETLILIFSSFIGFFKGVATLKANESEMQALIKPMETAVIEYFVKFLFYGSTVAQW